VSRPHSAGRTRQALLRRGTPLRRRGAGGSRDSVAGGCGRVMGMRSGSAGAAGGLCGTALGAPRASPRPAPGFTVHKGFSLQEQQVRTPPPDADPAARNLLPGMPAGGHFSRHIPAFQSHFMIWVTLIGS
jgi:hypothetical protein